MISIVQPLEFIKLTPRTNCKECGYSTCLAFAAAVTKGGEDPLKCPHLDACGLGDEFVAAGRETGGLSRVAGLLAEKERALAGFLKNRAKELDFSVLAPRLGCQWSGPAVNSLCFRYLGRDVRLSPQGVFFDDREVEEPRDQILLYNYVQYGGGDPLSGEWVGMESLPNSISKVRTLRVYCEERIAAGFCGKTALLTKCVAAIDGVARNVGGQGCSAAFRVPVLPRLAMMLVFWDEDPEEGFPPRVKILYDKNVLSVLDLESLVFACERMAERLLELSE